MALSIPPLPFGRDINVQRRRATPPLAALLSGSEQLCSRRLASALILHRTITKQIKGFEPVIDVQRYGGDES